MRTSTAQPTDKNEPKRPSQLPVAHFSEPDAARDPRLKDVVL